jgi:MYXO-CTERM domain-containing protein
MKSRSASLGRAFALLGVPAITAAITLAPNPAQACGGTFCDNTGPLMPVDQRGEDILFIQDGPEIEVHVRIQYTGEAEHFAWLVPLQSLPEISVGSDPLFVELADATAPRWRTSESYQCPDEEPGSGGTLSFVPDEDFASASEPDIVFEEQVGAFEVVVLQGGTAAEVINFLDQNGYAQDPDAEPILQEYLDEGFLFAAVKLTAAAETEDIHPLVFRMVGDEPCVPLRLTRIAAEDDMGVRVYFLNQQRWAPRNYDHVVLNTLAFPWTSATNLGVSRQMYTEQLTAAVDLAGGRAFATDYAGTSADVDTFSIYRPEWDESAFIGSDPVTAIELIAILGLNTHPLIQGLLMQFIPPPDGMDPTDFWNNIEQFQDLIDLAAWDDVAFAAALGERIVEPAMHAADLLDAWPYLTRLQTTISPHEMTVDPIFAPAPDLDEVSNEITTEGLNLCGENGWRYLVPWAAANPVPVCLGENGNAWPLALSEYPALRIERIPEMGPPQVLENFSQDIVAAWMDHQVEQGCAQDPGGEDTGGTGDSGGAGSESDTGDAGLNEGGDKAGCACRTSDTGGPLGFALGLLGLACVGGLGRWRREHESQS